MAGGGVASSLMIHPCWIVFSSGSRLREPDSSPAFGFEKRVRVRCFAKKKISFVDQILDYIEGGPKLRKWYGAPDILSKDGPAAKYEDEYPEEEEQRDAVLITDGDSEIGQMIILQLIVKQTRVKALVKDKRAAMEAFGTYVEAISGDASDIEFSRKALRGVRAIISPNGGFFSNAASLKGIKHAVLLSKSSVYKGREGIQSLMNSKAKRLSEQDESTLLDLGIPYTIIKAGALKNRPGGKGLNFEGGCAEKGSLSKEDAALICAEALAVVPERGLIFEVVNGEEVVSDWQEHLKRLMVSQGSKN